MDELRSDPGPDPGPDARTDATLAALPVALALAPHRVAGARRWLEGSLGWQAVEDAADAPVPPVMRLADVAGAAARGLGGPEDQAAPLPTLLLVGDDDPPALAADVGRVLRPAAVCRWPSERDAVPRLAAAALRAPRRVRRDGRVLRVGGLAGGVGTTTVVLALAGLSAWRGVPALAVVHGTAGVRGATPVPPDALSAPDLWARAAPLPGVGAGRAVHTGRGPASVTPADPRIGLAVLDAGVDAEADVVVCRPDAAAVARLPATTAGAVVVVGEGVLPVARLAALAGGRRVVVLPTSVRVARAVLRGQVPAGLPGRWLAALGPVLGEG